MITVKNRPELGRYQVYVGRQVAGYSAYELHGAHVAFMHTQIEEEFAGQGLGVRLVAHALTEIRDQGGFVLPCCPFVRSFIAQRPAFRALVPSAERAMFGLADGPAAEAEATP